MSLHRYSVTSIAEDRDKSVVEPLGESLRADVIIYAVSNGYSSILWQEKKNYIQFHTYLSILVNVILSHFFLQKMVR